MYYTDCRACSLAYSLTSINFSFQHLYFTFPELDDVFPATQFTTSQLDGKVRLRLSDQGYGAQKPITVQTFFKKTVDKIPDSVALGKFCAV